MKRRVDEKTTRRSKRKREQSLKWVAELTLQATHRPEVLLEDKRNINWMSAGSSSVKLELKLLLKWKKKNYLNQWKVAGGIPQPLLKVCSILNLSGFSSVRSFDRATCIFRLAILLCSSQFCVLSFCVSRLSLTFQSINTITDHRFSVYSTYEISCREPSELPQRRNYVLVRAVPLFLGKNKAELIAQEINNWRQPYKVHQSRISKLLPVT